MKLQKEVKSNPKQPSSKKSVRPQSYITVKLKNMLGLTALKKEPVSLNVFGSQSFSRQQYDLVDVKLLGRC